VRPSRLTGALARLGSPWVVLPAAVGVLAALTLGFGVPLVVTGLLAGVALLFLLLHPVAATLITLFLVYANVPVLASRLYGVPTPVAASTALLLALPLAHHLVLRRAPIRADRTFALMLLLLAVMAASATLAPAPDVAVARIRVFVVEGIVLYWLVVNVVRDLATFRRVVWTLLAAGALLGGLGAWQAVSDSYGREFGGLAHRETEVRLSEQTTPDEPTEVRVSNRASGPVDDPNRFGQILIVLLPLALFCYRTVGSRIGKMGAAAAGALVLGGIVLTYSRGAFLVLVALALAAVWMRWLRASHVLAGGLALVVALPFIAPTYRDRIASIGGARALLEDHANVQADGAIRGRTTEMLAAMHAFIDHPVLGVGPGQYAPVYSVEYQTRPGIAFRDLRVPRRAHSLYLEMAAELGALGLAVFLSIVGLLLRDLVRARRRSGSPETTELATALAFGLVAYLGTAAFLHLSFERYFWLLLAVVSAGVHVIGRGDAVAARAPERPPPFRIPTLRTPRLGPLRPVAALERLAGSWRLAAATRQARGGWRPATVVRRAGRSWRPRGAFSSARAWASAALDRGRAAASAANAGVQQIGGAALAALQLVGSRIEAAVEALGATALAGCGRVRSRWPSALRETRDALRPDLPPSWLLLAERAARACRAALRRARAAASAAWSRYFFRALDAVLTAPAAEDPQRSLGGIFVPIRQAHFKRIQTAANALEARWPRLALHIRESLVREQTLAFAAFGRPELLGYGAGSTVYRMPVGPGGDGDAVLKVLRRSLGRSPRRVLAEARAAQASYRRLAELYAGGDLVVPTRYLVLQAPLLGQPAAACLQPCLCGEMRDLFEHKDRELLGLLLEDPTLAGQFRLFARRTAECARKTRRCIDLIGHSNVLILRTPEGPRMRIIDFGVMQLDDLLLQRPRVALEIRRRIARLVRLDAALTFRTRRARPARPHTGPQPGDPACPR
jgi:hypothetical protein